MMSRRPLVAGNWKMNLTRAEGKALLAEVSSAIHPNVDVLVFPSFTLVPVLAGQGVPVGAQDVFWADRGAFTSQISAPMVRDAGAVAVLIGHSETRGRFGKLEVPPSTVNSFGETNETVRLKIAAALKEGLSVILCVGESLAEREAEQTEAVIREQLVSALSGLSLEEVTIAYEPVWAIGTGKTCEPGEAERICAMIRSVLASLGNAEAAEKVRILYGGSMKADNAAQLLAQPNIDGGLVGGASLVAADFKSIIEAAAHAQGS